MWIRQAPVDVLQYSTEQAESHQKGPGADFFGSADWFTCLQRAGFSHKPLPRIYHRVANPEGTESSHSLFLREEPANKRLLSLTNHYSIVFNGIDGIGALPSSDVEALARVIAAERPAWTEVGLQYLRGDRPLTACLQQAFRGAGYVVALDHHTWNWFMSVADRSFDAYIGSRPGRLRNTLARKTRQAERRHVLRFRLVTLERELQQGIEDYRRIYARSWKAAEASPQFVPELMRLCARRGILRLGILYLDDTPAAAQFWIASEEKAWIYKLAQDPACDDLSVGTLLTAKMFEQAIDVDRVREVDFGVGDEAYKQDWMEDRRQLVSLQALNPRTVRGAALVARLAIRDGLRCLGLRAYTPVMPAGAGTACDAGQPEEC